MEATPNSQRSPTDYDERRNCGGCRVQGSGLDSKLRESSLGDGVESILPRYTTCCRFKTEGLQRPESKHYNAMALIIRIGFWGTL